MFYLLLPYDLKENGEYMHILPHWGMEMCSQEKIFTLQKNRAQAWIRNMILGV